MDRNPIDVLRKQYRPPGNASEGPASASINRAESPYFGAKRVKSNSGMVFRDEETTGYEDDGSETGWVNTAPNRSAGGAGHVASARLGLTPLGLKNKASSANRGHQEESTRSGAAKDTYWNCLWRKPQAKKHKTWDNDGILIVSGSKATLKDKDTTSTIGTGSVASAMLTYENEITIGGKDVQILEQIPARSYLDGSCFGKGAMAMHAASTAAANNTALNNKPITSSATSFYGAKPTGKKFVPPSSSRPPAYGSTRIGLPPPVFPGAKSKSQHNSYDDLDNPIANASFPSTSGYIPVGASSKTAAATTGLGKAPPGAKAVHDPTREGAVVMKRPNEEHESKFNKKKYPVVDVVIDPIIGNKLRDHQKEGVKFMYESVMGMKTEGQGCILADEMGLGKTIQSVALIYTLLKQTPYYGEKQVIQRALIACPVSLVKNWHKEFVKWLGRDKVGIFMASGKADIKNFGRNRGYNILIIGYERLRTVVDDLKSIQPPIGLIICDEGHRLKSAGAKTTQALQSFTTARRIILSGTPIQNELSEFHAMVDFVNPGLLDSYQTFKKMYEQPILKAREPRCNPDAKILGEARGDALIRITKLFVLRRTSDIIAGYLPPKAEYVVFVAPTELQVKIYNHVLGSSELRQVLSAGASGLVLIQLLKKVCNTPGLLLRDDGEGNDAELTQELRSLCPSGTRPFDVALSGKLLAVKSLLESLRENTDEKIVLVSNYKQTLNVLEQLCVNSRYTYCRLDGSTKQHERQDIVDDFNRTSQNTRFVFLLSSKAGGTGLNIIGASRLVLFDSDWNPSNDLQAMARIHRDGQKRPCVIYRILTTGTMDEKIYQRQIMKTGLAGSLMDGDGSKEGKGKDAFAPKDLREIFKLHLDTGCQTHDLLSCDCRSGDTPEVEESENVDAGSDSDSDDDMPDTRFVKASQYQPPKDKELKSMKKLQALKEWTHIDCATQQEESAIDNIEDEVLRDVVEKGLDGLKLEVSRQSRREFSPASEDEEKADADGGAGVKKVPRYQGGEISFVFHKKVVNI